MKRVVGKPLAIHPGGRPRRTEWCECGKGLALPLSRIRCWIVLSVDMGVRVCMCVLCFPIAMRGVARARVAGEFSLRGYVSD